MSQYKFDSKIIRKFHYIPATATDLKATFARLKREARERDKATAQISVVPLKRGKA